MELHPLFRRVVGFQDPLALHDGVGLQHHVPGEAVNVQLALYMQMLALFHPVHNGLPLVAGEEFGDAHRTGVVGHVEADHPRAALFQLPVVYGEHVPLHNNGPHVQLQTAHGKGVLFYLMPPIDELSLCLGARFFPGGLGDLEFLQGLPADGLRPREGVLLHRHRSRLRCLRSGNPLNFSRRLFGLKLQRHPLHPVSQGDTALQRLLLRRKGQGGALHHRPNSAGAFVNHSLRHQQLFRQLRQHFPRRPGGKQLQKWYLLRHLSSILLCPRLVRNKQNHI